MELIYQSRHNELDMFVWVSVEQYNAHASDMGVPDLPTEVHHNTEI